MQNSSLERPLKLFFLATKSCTEKQSGSSPPGGKTTVTLLAPDLANKALGARELSFEHASYQSKVRFGLKPVVKDAAGVAALSKFFHKFMNGKKVIAAFEASMVRAVNMRLAEAVNQECKGRGWVAIISLQSLVSRVVFAANVESIFGEDVYTPTFYEDYLLFCKSIGYRSASAVSQEPNDADRQEMDDAKSRLLQALRTARESWSASPLVRNILSKLDTDPIHADQVALLLLWGSNINLLPTSVWLVADLLKDEISLAALRRERQSRVADASDSFVDLTHQSRPLLSAVVAEGLRVHSQPNLYRVAVADCTLKTKNDEIKIRSGEWVHMFPRDYLHHNPDFYPQPKEFHPFERFGNPSQVTASLCPCRGADEPTNRRRSSVGIGSSKAAPRAPSLRQSITQVAYRSMFGVFSDQENDDDESAGISTMADESSVSMTSSTGLRPALERKASQRSSILFRLLGPSESKDEASTNPFLAGNQHLRAFGGGKAPCPGKDYAVSILKTFVDAVLLSPDSLVEITLADEDAPLPPAVTQTVASTPPASKDIMIRMERVTSEK